MSEHPDRVGDWMQSFTGRQFWPLDPRPEEIFIEDIAHSLANQCRFGGHCKIFYSVAQHSVLVSEQFGLPILQLWGLLHDASEAYLVDVPRPLKYEMPIYQAAEQAFMNAICTRFGLPFPVPDGIKEIDTILLLTEQRDIMTPAPEPWGWAANIAPLAEKIIPVPSYLAEGMFMRRYEELRGSFPNLPPFFTHHGTRNTS